MGPQDHRPEGQHAMTDPEHIVQYVRELGITVKEHTP